MERGREAMGGDKLRKRTRDERCKTGEVCEAQLVNRKEKEEDQRVEERAVKEKTWVVILMRKVMAGGREWVEPRRCRVRGNRRDQQNDDE